MPRNSRKYLILLVALAALGFFLYKFRNSITLEGFRWSMVGASLRHANWALLLLSVVTIYACFAIRSLRWMRFCRWLGPTKFWNVYPATLMGFTCSFLLGRAAEPVRPVLIARKDSLTIPGMLGVYFLERVFDAAATAVLAGFALLMFQRNGVNLAQAGPFMRAARSAGALLIVGLVVVAAFLVYFRFHGRQWVSEKLQHEKWRTGWRERVAALLEGFADGLHGIQTLNDLGVLIAYSAVHWLLVIFVYYWVMHAFNGELAGISFAGAMLALAFTLVGSAAQLPGVGGGAQIATGLVLTLVFGIAKEQAVTASIVLWLISFASCCIAGLPLLLREGWSMGDLRKMAVTEEKAAEAELIYEAEHAAESGDGQP